MPITYVLFSEKTNRFYTGSSHDDNIEIRMRTHNLGGVRSTKYGRPWKLVEVENFSSYTDARKRELFLKTGVGRQYIHKNFGYLKEK
ncbi:MAG: GIY-YIG nuclease family protein [Candidatus Paceibacterota bacterium]|jgi:putative endonuclease